MEAEKDLLDLQEGFDKAAHYLPICLFSALRCFQNLYQTWRNLVFTRGSK